MFLMIGTSDTHGITSEDDADEAAAGVGPARGVLVLIGEGHTCVTAREVLRHHEVFPIGAPTLIQIFSVAKKANAKAEEPTISGTIVRLR